MVNLLTPSLTQQVLVVPPFECAWLTGENYLLRDGQGCISFEVKGDNDVTLILKPQCGSRRWQHLSLSPRKGGSPPAEPTATGSPQSRAHSPVEANYTVILGSHRNSCLKIEKDGELCHLASNVPGSKLSSTSFTKFWVSYESGAVAIGTGEPGPATACCRWTDPDPIENIRFVGLSAWDKHIGYKNIKIQTAVEFSDEKFNSANGETSSGYGAFEPLPTLVELCCMETLRNLIPQNICWVLTVADAIAPVVDGLRARAIDTAAGQLSEILLEDPEGFQGLNVASLAEILQNQSLLCSEKVLFDALVLWAGGSDALTKEKGHHHRRGSSAALLDFILLDNNNNLSNNNTGIQTGVSSRYDNDNVLDDHLISPIIPPAVQQQQSNQQRLLSDVESLLPDVRFPLMTPSELDSVESHPLHKRSFLLQELVAEARRGGAPSRAAVSVRADRLVSELTPTEAAASARFQRRRSPQGCTQLIYMYDGDHNGVCWHMGTRYGSQKWINPVVAGLLSVKASSPVARGTDPRALLSGAFLRTNFAGPRRESTAENGLASWWSLDLGPGHLLECNYYTLRADGSPDFLRNWALQGSQDGVAWSDLRRHDGDRTLNLPGQYASWPVGGVAATTAYRYFRIYLLAPNGEAANPHRLCLSYFELYGNFYREGEDAASVPREDKQ